MPVRWADADCVHFRRRRAAAGLLLLVAWVLLAGCATPAPTAVVGAAPAWPAPPDRTRIRYIGALSASPAPAQAGFLSWLVHLLFGEESTRDLVLRKPSAVAFDATGAVYVTDLARADVVRIAADGSAWTVIARAGSPWLLEPVGVAVWRDSVFVVDARTGKIGVLSVAGEPLAVIAPDVRRPTAIAVDSAELFLVDADADQIVVTDHAGTVRRRFGVRADGGAGLNRPTNIARRGDTVFVVDAMHFRVAEFRTDGRFLGAFGTAGDGPGYFARPRGIALDPDGHVYVVDGLLDAVQIFSPTGEFLLDFGGPGDERPGRFALPAGIAIANDGRIVVADSYHHRVQLFQYLP